MRSKNPFSPALSIFPSLAFSPAILSCGWNKSLYMHGRLFTLIVNDNNNHHRACASPFPLPPSTACPCALLCFRSSRPQSQPWGVAQGGEEGSRTMIAALPDQRCVALRMAQNNRNLLGMISKRRSSIRFLGFFHLSYHWWEHYHVPRGEKCSRRKTRTGSPRWCRKARVTPRLQDARPDWAPTNLPQKPQNPTDGLCLSLCLALYRRNEMWTYHRTVLRGQAHTASHSRPSPA